MASPPAFPPEIRVRTRGDKRLLYYGLAILFRPKLGTITLDLSQVQVVEICLRVVIRCSKVGTKKIIAKNVKSVNQPIPRS